MGLMESGVQSQLLHLVLLGIKGQARWCTWEVEAGGLFQVLGQLGKNPERERDGVGRILLSSGDLRNISQILK